MRQQHARETGQAQAMSAFKANIPLADAPANNLACHLDSFPSLTAHWPSSLSVIELLDMLCDAVQQRVVRKMMPVLATLLSGWLGGRCLLPLPLLPVGRHIPDLSSPNHISYCCSRPLRGCLFGGPASSRPQNVLSPSHSIGCACNPGRKIARRGQTIAMPRAARVCP